MTPEIEKAIAESIRVNVNGKIDAMRMEQVIAHKSLHDEISLVKDSMTEMKEAFDNASGFFKTSVVIARWFVPVGTAAGILYAGYKFISK